MVWHWLTAADWLKGLFGVFPCSDELGRFVADKRCLASLKMEGCSNLGGFVLCSSSLSTLWLSDLYSLSKMVIIHVLYLLIGNLVEFFFISVFPSCRFLIVPIWEKSLWNFLAKRMIVLTLLPWLMDWEGIVQGCKTYT